MKCGPWCVKAQATTTQTLFGRSVTACKGSFGTCRLQSDELCSVQLPTSANAVPIQCLRRLQESAWLSLHLPVIRCLQVESRNGLHDVCMRVAVLGHASTTFGRLGWAYMQAHGFWSCLSPKTGSSSGKRRRAGDKKKERLEAKREVGWRGGDRDTSTRVHMLSVKRESHVISD